MKIISFNVNGLRAVLQKGFLKWMAGTNADYVCLQEVKYDEPHLLNDLFSGIGYEHQYWYPAVKKGYSGVAVLAKKPAIALTKGSGQTDYDTEGRILRVDTEHFTLVNVYVPSGTTGEVRQAFKMAWLTHFRAYLAAVKQSSPLPLLVCGDFNIAHEETDIHNPKANARTSGFLPEERQWLSDFLADGFVDTFRFANPRTRKYSWWTYRANARSRDLGWRIDYHFVCRSLAPRIVHADSATDVCFSDHCPVVLELRGEW
ncbi:MAG: exodeoxyribonuclease III [Cytophagales bacterium]|nr:exodeoxyribonuclease III [Cytophagales bacterium]